MLGVLPSAQSHFTPSQGRGGDNTDPNADAVAAQKSIVNATPELTSGQHDADTSKLEPYEAFPQEVTGPTLWTADDYRSESAKPKWVRWWSADEISQIEAASKLWKESGRPLTEIEQNTFPLAEPLAGVLRQLKEILVNGQGFFLLKGLPTQRWGIEITAIAYLGLGSHLGQVVSQNHKGHVLGHVKDIGGDPTQIHKVRIYSTNARQFFHTDSSGGIVGLLCLHKALEGGESDIVSAHEVWNTLQKERPDVARTLAANNWHFDRKGEVSEGERGWVTRPVFSFHAGRVTSTWDPYYIRSIGRHVDAGLIPALTDAQKEAMEVLEATAQKLALHMILDVGDMQFVSDLHVFHARTAYRDHPPPQPRRHLLRLWLSTPESAGGWPIPYPDSSHPRRAGIQVNNTPPKCPLEAE